MKTKASQAQYWPVFREVFWAAAKSSAIVLLFAGFLISSAILMINLEDDMSSEGMQRFYEIIFSGVLLALGGFLLWLPFAFALVLAVGTPIALFLINKGYVSEWVWAIAGAFSAGLIVAAIGRFSEFPDYSLLGGALTGYFACRQTANLQKP